MPAISKIRFTNVIYENGDKRYNDDIFEFDGYNGAILLENGGGKTVYVQTLIQAILPHAEVADRKIKDTLRLENNAAHIAVEWIVNEKPRRYALTVVTLFMNNSSVNSLKYVYEYDEGDDSAIEKLPFVIESLNGKNRAATKEEMSEYYYLMSRNRINAHTFDTIKDYNLYIEDNFKIIPSEWKKIALINGAEGGVEAFFDACKTTGQLVDNLLIPTVEEALAGNGTKDFVDTFEKQREHFKKYKQLNTRIEESKRVEKQIDSYVKVYESYDNVKSDETKIKENLKSLYNFAMDENNIVKDKIQKNSEDKINLDEKYDNLNQKELSYNLELVKMDMNKNEKALKTTSDKYNKLLENKEKKTQRYSSLEVAKFNYNLKIEEETIDYLNKEIEQLDTDEEVVDINESLLQNSKELRGYYLDKEDKLKKQKNIVEGQIKSNNDEFKTNENNLKWKENEKNIKDKEISKINGENTSLIKDMDKIKNAILANPNQEKVEEQFEKWKDRITVLEKDIFNYGQQKEFLKEEKKTSKEYLSNSRHELDILNKEESQFKGEIKNIEEKQNLLLKEIKQFRSSWFNMDSLYLKQSTILDQIESKLERLRDEKEECIYKERLSHKFLDEYSESEYYTADSVIEKLIKSWRNQFSYIESGTQYIQRVGKSVNKSELELNEIYPYWTMSLIVSEVEVEKIMKEARKKCDDISHPIIVMSEKEARNRVQGDILLEEKNVLFPGNWEKNIKQDYFENWKEEINIKAKESTELRKKKEAEFNSLNVLLNNLREFYSKYPYEIYNDMRKHLKELQDNIYSYNKEIEKTENRLTEIDDEINKIDRSVTDFSIEKNTLEININKAQEYLNKDKEREKNINRIKEISKNIEIINEEISILTQILKEKSDIKDELQSQLNNIEQSIGIIQAGELYEEVKNISPSYTNISEEVLKEKRKNLKDALENKQKDRRIFYEKIKSAREKKNSLEKDLEKFKKKLDVKIDENIDFLSFSEIEINGLMDELEKLKVPLKEAEKEFNEANDEYKTRKTTYNIRKEDFLKKYDEIISFDISLDQSQIQIKREKEALDEKKKYLVKEKKRLEAEENDIENSISELRFCNAKYSYLNEDIKKVELSEELKQQYPYKRKEILKENTKKIKEIDELLRKKNSEVEDKKKDFINFCSTEIMDVKLKSMASLGLESKNKLYDILEWQNRMKERIARTIVIAENDMREHDKEVQQFINHLYSYLSTIVQELKLIPKKTRIKIDEDFKEVFLFNIPEWNEKEGKEELARHIDWILNQLELESFKDENGIENQEQVKKAIEKWLQSKQLLQILMKQNNIKVKCRKVTNDGKMRSAPYSWEVSNSWSGGEKWSKNMTLFLGILNYLAEKRKQIIPSKKHYRTVIVDNPFGKASSEHVLDPVFFIAEQLGFQIIALTAHAEGKFIRTYFPIVYSLRLRNANSGNSQIMTKEEEIKIAFFKDNDPETLIRLGQIKQIGIFDYEEI